MRTLTEIYRTNLLFGKVLRHQQASIEPETWPMFLLNSTSAFTKQNPSFRLKQIQSISYLFRSLHLIGSADMIHL